MLKVTKFGGSSLCDSAGFSRVREIVLADPARRVVSSSCQRQANAMPLTTRSQIFFIFAMRICNTA